MMSKREYRSADLMIGGSADDNDEMIVEGYAAVFNQPTVLWSYDGIDYKEEIDAGAFDNADLSDVIFRYNHSSNVYILARTKNNTLSLTVDNIGLKIRAKIAQTQTGRDFYTLVKRGDIDKMSFGFVVEEEAYNRETHTRRILKFKTITDVSGVDFPAYEGTSIAEGRSAEDLFKKYVVQRNDEEIRKRLLLKLI
nr:MAG TPA: prohead serine protease [Caudoviricetes sp.]